MSLGRCAPPAVLGGISLTAWAAIFAGVDSGVIGGLCGPATMWTRLPTLPSLLVAFYPPTVLAAEWALMAAAMMPPLVEGPLRHLSDRSFAKRRCRAMVLFVAGYSAVWLAAGIVLQSLALASRLAAAGSFVPISLTMIVAFVWQVSPAKQLCLNGCHRRPPLAAFGLAADRDALGFGFEHGTWCVGTCWALMLLPRMLERGHIAAMIVVGLFLFAERLERPGPFEWRLRVPVRVLRIVLAQVRMRLQPSR